MSARISDLYSNWLSSLAKVWDWCMRAPIRCVNFSGSFEFLTKLHYNSNKYLSLYLTALIIKKEIIQALNPKYLN